LPGPIALEELETLAQGLDRIDVAGIPPAYPTRERLGS
jgi:hypothetical protein